MQRSPPYTAYRDDRSAAARLFAVQRRAVYEITHIDA
jgi:hypothetical protein